MMSKYIVWWNPNMLDSYKRVGTTLPMWLDPLINSAWVVMHPALDGPIRGFHSLLVHTDRVSSLAMDGHGGEYV